MKKHTITVGNQLYKFAPEELTVVMGSETGKNLLDSMKFSYALAKQGAFGNVLYIDTCHTEKRAAEILHQEVDPNFNTRSKSNRFYCSCTTFNSVAALSSTWDQYIRDFDCRVIVISAWEYSSQNFSMREKLLYMVRQWLAMGVTVIVYGQRHGEHIPKAGVIERSKLGMLVGMAESVIVMAEVKENELADEKYTEKPMLIGVAEEDEEPQGKSRIIQRENPLKSEYDVVENQLLKAA